MINYDNNLISNDPLRLDPLKVFQKLIFLTMNFVRLQNPGNRHRLTSKQFPVLFLNYKQKSCEIKAINCIIKIYSEKVILTLFLVTELPKLHCFQVPPFWESRLHSTTDLKTFYAKNSSSNYSSNSGLKSIFKIPI